MRSGQNLIHLKKEPREFANGIEVSREKEGEVKNVFKVFSRCICHLQRWEKL
jgi:hypothetical protein